MSGGVKRIRASERLVARASPYHSSVTLFEQTADSGSSTPKSRASKRVKVEVDSEQVADVEDIISSSSNGRSSGKGPAKAKEPKARRVKPIPNSLEKPHPAPVGWRETYDSIKEMRSKLIAPVDTMGCDRAQLDEMDPKSQRFATLVSLMLSSQTKDEVTDAAVSKLRIAVGGSLSVEAVLNASEGTISDAIAKVGFWRRKTQYIIQTAQKLRDNFDSDIPKTVDELCSLPGVGPKMAFLALQVAWKLNVGIGVDVHVHRITNRLGWHKPPSKNPEETRLNLQSWLPIELHPDINHMLVGFGQTICLPVGPRCDLCTLSTSGLCPSAQKVSNTKNRPGRSPQKASPKVAIAVEVEQDSVAEMQTYADPSFEVKSESDDDFSGNNHD